MKSRVKGAFYFEGESIISHQYTFQVKEKGRVSIAIEVIDYVIIHKTFKIRGFYYSLMPPILSTVSFICFVWTQLRIRSYILWPSLRLFWIRDSFPMKVWKIIDVGWVNWNRESISLFPALQGVCWKSGKDNRNLM